MNFEDLDQRMRVFETAHDHRVLPGLWMVARLDGRGFTRLTKEVMSYEAPFDERFRDAMIATTRALFDGGFRCLYAYTQSDEISVLLHRDDEAFGRKLRKLNSVLAGTASAAMTQAIGRLAVFDCRVAQLPSVDLVLDTFRWRQADAHRNALNAHAYWMLRREGATAAEATAALSGKTVAWKNERLFQGGVNFDAVPTWQKRGVGVRWREVEKNGRNPRTGEEVVALRRVLWTDLELPLGDAYASYLRDLLG